MVVVGIRDSNMKYLGVFLSVIVLPLALNTLGDSVVKITLHEYVAYSTIGEWGVYVALAIAFLLFCWTQKNVFIPFSPYMRGKHVEYYGGNFSLFLGLAGLFPLNLQLILRADFGDGVTVNQILMVMAFNFLIPRIAREIYLYSLRQSRSTIYS